MRPVGTHGNDRRTSLFRKRTGSSRSLAKQVRQLTKASKLVLPIVLPPLFSRRLSISIKTTKQYTSSDSKNDSGKNLSLPIFCVRASLVVIRVHLSQSPESCCSLLLLSQPDYPVILLCPSSIPQGCVLLQWRKMRYDTTLRALAHFKNFGPLSPFTLPYLVNLLH